MIEGRDASSKGGIVHGTLRPRDASSEGRIVQMTSGERDGTYRYVSLAMLYKSIILRMFTAEERTSRNTLTCGREEVPHPHWSCYKGPACWECTPWWPHFREVAQNAALGSGLRGSPAGKGQSKLSMTPGLLFLRLLLHFFLVYFLPEQGSPTQLCSLWNVKEDCWI